MPRALRAVAMSPNLQTRRCLRQHLLTGFTLYIFTIYAAIYGFIFFDEKLESFHYLGTVLVFIGIYLAKKNYETKT